MAKKKKKLIKSQKLKKAYKAYFLENGVQPPSVYKFCKKIAVAESVFYDHFASFDILEQRIWQGFISETIVVLESDSGFMDFGVKEKMLACYFTQLEIFKKNRSYILIAAKEINNPIEINQKLKKYKLSFDDFFKSLITLGLQNGEIISKQYISDQYYRVFWYLNIFIVRFWLKDDSKGFEQTDAAIEKSVNVIFDLIGNGTLDNILDFGKFIYQSNFKL